MTLAGIRLRLNPLTPLMLLLAAAFSGGGALLTALCALALHESAHLLAALKLRARLDEIELMPFGGAIRLYSLWEAPAARLVLISLAGPAANILAACLLTLAVYISPALAPNVRALIEVNLILALFNLIPALPLDGGRALCALIMRKTSQKRAVTIGVWAGRALALIMLGAVVIAFIYTGKLYLYLVGSAVYILASGERERRQAEGARLRALLLAPDTPAAPDEARWVAARADESIYAAARMISPGKPHLIAVLDARGELVCVISQQRLTSALAKNAKAPLSTLIDLARADASPFINYSAMPATD